MKKLLSSLFTILALSAFAKVDITDVTYADKGRTGELSIKVAGQLMDTPEFKIVGNSLTVKVPDANIINKIDKKVALGHITANNSIVKFVLPFSLKGQESKVSILVRDHEVALSFPKLTTANVKTAAVGTSDKNSEKYDEQYLNQLLKSKEEKPAENKVDFAQAEDNDKKVESNNVAPAAASNNQKDEVKVALSSIKKEGANEQASDNKGFSLASMAGKLVAFLALVLLLFYGIVNLFKKGVMSKGKLGFLNSHNPLEVISTTFIGPKKNLMMVKAHNQVFLIATSENGVHFMSEIKDTVGIIKNGEEKIGGFNFDTQLGGANDRELEFNLKTNINVSEGVGAYSDGPAVSIDSIYGKTDRTERDKEILKELSRKSENVSDAVKFSDQIKKKVKSLKQFS